MQLPNELKAAMLADVAREPAPSRPQARRVFWLVVSGCVLLALVGFEALGRVHWHGRPPLYIVLATLAFGAVAVAATAFALPRTAMIGPSRRAALQLAVGAPVLAMLALLGLNLAFPETFASCGKRIGLVCLDLTLTLGAFPVLALILAQRRGLAVRGVEAGIGTGIAVGGWTGVGITLSCECTNPSHVALGHILPMIILGLFGAVVAWRASKRVR